MDFGFRFVRPAVHFEVLHFIFSSELNKIQSSMQILLTLNITHETKANKERELTFTGGMMEESFQNAYICSTLEMLETRDLCVSQTAF